jgi:hypothetical protein
MTAALHITCLALIASGWALPAGAEPGRDLATVLAEIDQGFVCPQFLPDDDARRAEMVAFSRALASVGPTRITYPQAAHIRAKMLERHNCTTTPTAVASTESATPPN